jgi:M6 family metalloprotease-like protein
MIAKLVSLDAARAAAPDPDRGLIWLVEAGGAPGLSSWDLGTERLVRHTDLPAAPTGVTLSAGGTRLLVAGENGAVVTVAADDPDAGPMPLATTQDELGQVAATRPRTGTGYGLVVSWSGDQLKSVRLNDGVVRPVVGIDGITGVAANARDMWAAATTDGVGRIVKVSAGGTQGVADGLLPTGHLTCTADRELLLAAHPGADRMSVLRFEDGSVTVLAVEGAGLDGTPVEAHVLDDGRVLLLTTGGLAAAQDLSDLRSRPRLVPPAAPLFVGSWVALQYDLSGSSLGHDDVSFVIHGDANAALVSNTALSPTPGARKVPMLVAGILLGRFEVAMVETATGRELDRVPFEVTDHWLQLDHGPSRMFAGSSAPAPAPAFGGGPNQPQNLGTLAHRGRWRVAVLLVNTDDGSYPTDPEDLAAARQAILDEVQDGVVVDGQTRSARQYYEEVSGWNPATGRGLTIAVHNNQVFGPVTLPEGWGTYFAQTTDDAGTVVDPRWAPRGATVQTVVTRALAAGVLTTTDLRQINVLLLVPFSPDAPGAGMNRFAWPYANSGVSVVVGPKPTDQETFGWAFMPPDWSTLQARRFHTTLAHEIGHTLGLPDLYDFPVYAPDVSDRVVTGWDIMATDFNYLPHYSLSNRMRQGWVEKGHIRLVNFQGGGGVTDQITLQAAEITSAPPSGRFRGIEIRLSDGWNAYVEYRARQAGQVSDALPDDRRVVITDVTSDHFAHPTLRPNVVLVHNDADGDGPVLEPGEDYEEIDPSTKKKLLVKVVSREADHAVVAVDYFADGADPGIRPWNGPPDWKSPDIRVTNDRANADPARWGNTPWLDHPNTLIATVRNNGDRAAKGVVVDFFAIEFTTGDGPMVRIGTDRRDIAPNAAQEFRIEWVPTGTKPHICIVVRIKAYVDPDVAGLLETNIYNNEARSNYTKFISASASPSTRVGTEVLLSNPFDISTLVSAVVRQTHDLHRVYVDHLWLRVGPRQQRPVRVLDEALAGFPEAEQHPGEFEERLWSSPNVISVEGWAARPFPAPCAALTRTGGAAVEVGAGRGTVVTIDEARVRFVTGTVAFADGASPPPSGTVLVEVQALDESGAVDPLGGSQTQTSQLDGGIFSTELRPLDAERTRAVAHYLGEFGAAPGDSEPIELRP